MKQREYLSNNIQRLELDEAVRRVLRRGNMNHG
jgi:hypothetical protein